MKDAVYMLVAVVVLVAALLVINDHTKTVCLFGKCATVIH